MIPQNYFHKNKCSRRTFYKPSFVTLAVFLAALFLLTNVAATLNVQLSNQGTDVRDSGSALIDDGNLTVNVYDAAVAGNLIYGELFEEVINSGAWNVMLGENTSNLLSLEYGKQYYMDYLINGEDVNFTDWQGAEIDRRAFYAPLGDIADEDISDTTNLTLGEKITFAFGEVIDNIVDGYLKLDGNVNVSNNLTVSGRVGIGTATPDYALDVAGNVGFDDFIYHNDDPNTYVRLLADEMQFVVGGDYFLRMREVSGQDYVSMGYVGDVDVGLGEPGEFFLQGSDGNIGLGTITPQGRLDINGSLYLNQTNTSRLILPRYNIQTTPTIAFGDGDTGIYQGADGNMIFTHDGSRGWIFYPTSTVVYTTDAPTIDHTATSSTNPTYTWTGDENTGIGSSGADELALITGGATRLIVNGSNVGIGTTNPTEALHVVGNITLTDSIKGITGNLNLISASGKVVVDNPGSANALSIYNSGAENIKLQAGANSFFTNNVGIGTEVPTQKLNVVGDANVTGTLYAGGEEVNKWLYNQTDAVSDVYVDIGGDTMTGDLVTTALNVTTGKTLLTGGNVGIGTDAPGSLLHAEGTAQAVTGTSAILRLTSTNGQAAGIGGDIAFGGAYTDAGAKTVWSKISGVKENSVTGNYAGAFAFSTREQGVGMVERMRIESGGDVGIGTNNPTQKFHVETSGAGQIVRFNTVDDFYNELQFTQDDAHYLQMGIEGASGGTRMGGTLANAGFMGMYDSNNLTFHTANAFRMVIDEAGNVGIGTNDPTYLLETKDTGSTTAVNLSSVLYVDADNNRLGLNFIAPQVDMQLDSDVGDATLRISGPGDNTFGGRIQLTEQDNNNDGLTIHYNGSSNKALLFMREGGADYFTRGITIQRADGNVGIGTNSPSYPLSVEAAAQGVIEVKGTDENADAYMYLFADDADDNADKWAIYHEGTTNDLDFRNSWAGVGSWTSVMTLESTTGNVGILNTTPVSALHVQGLITTHGTLGGMELFDNDVAGRVGKINTNNNDLTMFSDNGADIRFESPSGTKSLYLENGGDMGIGTIAPTQRLTLAVANGDPASSGTTSTAGFRMEDEDAYTNVLDMGLFVTSPFGAWIQSTDEGNLGTTYPLSLNPIGGNVGIGTASPTYLLETKDTGTTTAVNLSSVLYVDAANNRVGIGTDSPAAGQLVVTNPTYAQVYIDTTSANSFGELIFSEEGTVRFDLLQMNSNASSPNRTILRNWMDSGDILIHNKESSGGLMIYRDNNVGIGTEVPTHELNVVGDGNFTGNLYVGPDSTLVNTWLYNMSDGGADGSYNESYLLNTGDTATGDYVFSGTISSPGAGSDSERFGAGSEAAGQYAVAIGNIANASTTSSTALGYNARITAGGGAAIAIGKDALVNNSYGIAIGSPAYSDQYGVALGQLANVTKTGGTAVGYNSETSGTYDVALGYDALSSGLHGIAIGYQANASTDGDVAIGWSTVTSGTESVAIGYDATSVKDAVAMGRIAIAEGESSVSIGRGANASGLGGIAIGSPAFAVGDMALALGRDAKAISNSIGIGRYGNATGAQSVALGYSADATGNDDIAIGSNAKASGTFGVALGEDADSEGVNSIAIGRDANASDLDNIAIGYLAKTTSDNDIAIGRSTETAGTESLGIGYGAIATGTTSTAFGHTAKGLGSYSIALGYLSFSDNTDTIAIGREANATTSSTIAIGYDSLASGSVAISIGQQSKALGSQSISLGRSSFSGATDSMALGYLANASSTNDVAIGRSALTAGTEAVAIGYDTEATGADSIAMGNSAVASGAQSVSIGPSSDATYVRTVALGYLAQAVTNTDSTAIGAQAQSGQYAVAVGTGAIATESYSIAIGRLSQTIGGSSVAIGSSSKAMTNSIAIGNSADANATTGYATAVGTSSKALDYESTAFGGQAQATENQATAIGPQALASNTYASSLGYRAKATGSSSVAIGNIAWTGTTYGVALGYDTNASSASDISIGRSTVTSGSYATAIGYFTNALATDSIAIGNSADTTGTQAVAIGDNANATAAHDLAIGTSAKSIGGSSVAIGRNAAATINAVSIGYNSAASGPSAGVAIGNNAQSQASNVVAIGINSISAGTSSVAIGYGTNASAASSVAIGPNSIGNGVAIGSVAKAYGFSTAISPSSYADNLGIALGYFADSRGQDSAAVGSSANASGASSVSIGHDSKASGSGALAFGLNALSSGSYTVAIGRDSDATQGSGVALGYLSQVTTSGQSAVAVGPSANASAGAVAIGNTALALMTDSIAIGRASGIYSGTIGIAIGLSSKAGDTSIAIGQSTNASAGLGSDSVAIGNYAKAVGASAMAIGPSTEVLVNYGLAIGHVAKATGIDAVAYGRNSFAAGADSVALGVLANATGTDAIAIGESATTDNNNAIAMGRGASSSTGGTTIGTTASGLTSGVALGYGATYLVNNGIAIGYTSHSEGIGAIAIGREANASGSTAVAIGYQALAPNANTIILGTSGYKIGIGTSTPTHELNVVGDGNFTGEIFVGTGSTLINGTNIGIGTASPDGALEIERTGDVVIHADADGTFSDALLRLDRFAATDNAAVEFQTAGTTDWYMGNADYNLVGNFGGGFYIGQTLGGANPAFFINGSSEYVGIGTTTPTQELHVEGDVNITGEVFVGDDKKIVFGDAGEAYMEWDSSESKLVIKVS